MSVSSQPAAGPLPAQQSSAAVPPAARVSSVPTVPTTAPAPTGDGRRPVRPSIGELRLSAFAGHRGVRVPLGPLTLLAGPSGCGKSGALRAFEALARLGGGAELGEVFPDPVACVPEDARPDAQQRRGFRLGCTADGPEGPVRLDVAVQAEPALRIAGERLSAGGRVLLQTALRDPRRPSVQATWYTAGPTQVTRAALPDDRLGTALLPLRVSGSTEGERRVVAAAEQMVVALRSVFACAPRPVRMRVPAPLGAGRLMRGCDNLAAVLARTRTECGRRHALFVDALRAGCAGPVADVVTEQVGGGRVRAVLVRGDGRRTGFERLGDGELRYAALALVLLTGPGVLEVDPVGEVPEALQTLTVLADGLETGLDPRQRAALLRLAARMCERGHIRLTGTVSDASWARSVHAARVVDLMP
ncbi:MULTISPECIES: ATP-binding protein [Streptomyces]|uniref:ATP-binding protein n=1 Tax=Streptomyces thermoviolaceus subsp. thermoviolaceus TaxID=66860 RepID=A0ABX0YM79_STRTL|nr:MULTISPECIES: ATP-binding protein [Streptomyces]MCM3263307.1 ATP-binding protein [Streptomyces thermoviolaceus]NJP13173.1 ATP-binding protein [Streptomyces thermoviolaceus subsp. thermoviolaceus]RSR95346.1 ATP-binding protein [Streptomyces sp. WAC00469]WTD46995.1 ATP-binding protein [Streptomyces thermoviolaceus]